MQASKNQDFFNIPSDMIKYSDKFTILSQEENKINENSNVDNLFILDDYGNVDLIINCINSILDSNPSYNLQTIEKLCRSNNLRTYLVANPFWNKHKLTLCFPGRNITLKSNLMLFLDKQEKKTFPEIKEYYDSYDDNFKELEFCGFLKSKNDANMDKFSSNIGNKKTEDMNINEKVLSGKFKLTAYRIDAMEKAKEDIDKAKKQYLVDPVIKFVQGNNV